MKQRQAQSSSAFLARFRGPRFFLVVFLFSFIVHNSSLIAATYPSWWTNRNVITNTAATNDWAGANQGQMKWFATNACDELNANLPNGAGTGVLSLVQGFTSSNNYMAVNLGQLKNAGKQYYDRLIAEGYTNKYPWTGAASTNDYSMVNLGQMKNVFSFDLTKDSDSDGLADWRETGTGIFVWLYNTGSSSINSDSDGDGIQDGTELTNRTNPNSSDTNKPAVFIRFPTNNSVMAWVP